GVPPLEVPVIPVRREGVAPAAVALIAEHGRRPRVPVGAAETVGDAAAGAPEAIGACIGRLIRARLELEATGRARGQQHEGGGGACVGAARRPRGGVEVVERAHLIWQGSDIATFMLAASETNPISNIRSSAVLGANDQQTSAKLSKPGAAGRAARDLARERITSACISPA